MFLKIVGTIFEVIPSAKKLFTKNEKKMIMSTCVEAHQKFDFSIQKSWFLCNI